jgi:hypothetical protein
MTLENVTDIEGLFRVIDHCKGAVALVSPEGDIINLKSKLAQLLAVSGVFAEGYIRSLELHVQESEDMDRILKFALEQNSAR